MCVFEGSLGIQKCLFRDLAYYEIQAAFFSVTHTKQDKYGLLDCHGGAQEEPKGRPGKPGLKTSKNCSHLALLLLPGPPCIASGSSWVPWQSIHSYPYLEACGSQNKWLCINIQGLKQARGGQK